jgi:hypothetical protein
MGVFGLRGRLFHEAGILAAHAQRQGRKHVGDDVDEQDLQGQQGVAHAQETREGDHEDFAQVAREQEQDELADVLEDDPPLGNGRHDGGERIILEHHVGGFGRYLRAPESHCNADVRFFEGRGVVHAVAGHAHDVALLLVEFDHVELLGRAHPGKHPAGEQRLFLPVGELV